MASMIERNHPIYVQSSKPVVFPAGTVPVLTDGTGGMKVFNTSTKAFDSVTTITQTGQVKDTVKVSGDTSVNLSSASTTVVLGAAAATVTLQIPGSTIPDGAVYEIWDSTGTASSQAHTIQVPNGQTINGQSSFTFNTDYGMLSLLKNGSNWLVS